ncbi:MAG: MFS transporter [Eubacterium sp.]|nr:MFS transporter [Eubacterium sp.]
MKQQMKTILPYAISVYAGAAIMNMCTNLTGSVLSDIMTHYHMNLDRGGMMSFFQFLGGIAAILIAAGIADRMKKPFLLMLAFLLTALALLGIGVRPPVSLFMVLYLLLGASLGLIDMNNNAVLSDLFHDSRDSALSVLHGICGLGATLIPVITAVIGTGNWGTIYRSAAIIILIILVLHLFLYFRARKAIDSRSVPLQHAETASGSAGSREVFRNPAVWIGALSVICYGAAQGGITVWGVKYCKDIFADKSALACAMALSLYWFGTMIGRLSVGLVPALRAMKSRTLVTWGGIFAGIVLLPGVLGKSYGLLMAGIFLFGILNAPTLPRIISLVADWYPHKTGLISGINCISLYIGLAVIPLLMGVIGEFAGMKIMMLTPVVMTIVSGLFGMLLPRK